MELALLGHSLACPDPAMEGPRSVWTLSGGEKRQDLVRDDAGGHHKGAVPEPWP